MRTSYMEGRPLGLSPAVFFVLLGGILLPGSVLAQHPDAVEEHGHHHHHPEDPHENHAQESEAHGHAMLTVPVGDRWVLAGMAQLFPMASIVRGVDDSPFERSEALLSQGAAMLQLERHDGRWAVRFTPNFEGFTMRDGELTPGGWGEGFLDARHPHTLLHELMVSRNHRSAVGLSWSVSAGRGFVPFGSDDPMGRPVAKYPTNHHLAQILERYTVNAAVGGERWVVEGGVFDGTEPEDPWDVGNWREFGNSFAVRVLRAWGPGASAIGSAGHGESAAHGWETSVSLARVVEHGDPDDATWLVHGGVRFEGTTSAGDAYLLLEGARSFIDHGPVDGYESLLAEGALTRGGLRGYARGEWATRPEYPRSSGEDGFFRYDHHDPAEGATRWIILSAGVEVRADWGPVAVRPFGEAALQRARRQAGDLDPRFPADRWFTGLTAGVRIFPGGGPMRMGPYGLRDDMSRMLREHGVEGPDQPHHEEMHHHEH